MPPSIRTREIEMQSEQALIYLRFSSDNRNPLGPSANSVSART
jgi:hypothetical protein